MQKIMQNMQNMLLTMQQKCEIEYAKENAEQVKNS